MRVLLAALAGGLVGYAVGVYPAGWPDPTGPPASAVGDDCPDGWCAPPAATPPRAVGPYQEFPPYSQPPFDGRPIYQQPGRT